MEIYGRFWVKESGKNYLGLGRVDLLRGIEQTGSISQSAKAMKMSYKAAWDSIDAINNLSDLPLVERFIGGAWWQWHNANGGGQNGNRSI